MLKKGTALVCFAIYSKGRSSDYSGKELTKVCERKREREKAFNSIQLFINPPPISFFHVSVSVYLLARGRPRTPPKDIIKSFTWIELKIKNALSPGSLTRG
ncbi:unnamed protein product [Brassica napus]|uniref:(rape) hypothetical protein n=1 Tax=Brassica napus TaxID=3708 RepID=A0A816MP00_BRANA|nr:unnamed protein product [Brassica napus]